MFGDVGCDPKVAYLTWAQAQRAAKNLMRRKSVRCHVYHCRKCGYAHVGTH